MPHFIGTEHMRLLCPFSTVCRFSSFLSLSTALTWPDESLLIELSPAFSSPICHLPQLLGCDDSCHLSADDQPGISQATRLPLRRVIAGGVHPLPSTRRFWTGGSGAWCAVDHAQNVLFWLML